MTSLRLAACSLLLLLAAAADPPPAPWFGTWKLRLANPAEPPETLIYSDAGGGAMRMESVEENSILVTRFDGTPAPVGGKAAAAERTLAVTAVSPTSYRWLFAVAGSPRVAGINTLADDGRSFTERSWRVTAPEKVVTLIYDRQ
ncbi:hypothetical protein SAMN06297144_0860 [Sphingomonas guangdongensis]|uniref:Lipocalin-like domain-containing protein n=1 Tax=Sphingomonas guangdongensis TaxID=1141890 RepID=A0A285QDL2_9SPHN|nr:hypothetical protein [Sphingomonas guangdongensis]SOB80040.1 hypothetical protein SAMN06297144_0860 [Sphingomonas guangdongensis]